MPTHDPQTEEFVQPLVQENFIGEVRRFFIKRVAHFITNFAETEIKYLHTSKPVYERHVSPRVVY